MQNKLYTLKNVVPLKSKGAVQTDLTGQPVEGQYTIDAFN